MANLKITGPHVVSHDYEAFLTTLQKLTPVSCELIRDENEAESARPSLSLKFG
jgi:hypothetical protein